MANLGLEIVFWIILLMYIGVRIAKNKKGFKQQYQNKLPMKINLGQVKMVKLKITIKTKQ